MAGPWEKYAHQPAPQGPAMSAPQVIQGPARVPDPYQVAKDQRDETREDRRDRREENKTGFTQQNQSIDNMKALRQEFAQLPEVKNYQTLLQQFGTAAKAPENGAGDLSIIYAFGKANDPSSAVREGELSLAQQTASLPQELQQWVSRIQNGQRLTPEVRHNLVEAIRQKGIAAARAYNLQRDFYRNTSERYKYDPELVVGPHPGGPFQPTEADFTGNVIRNRDQSLGAIPGGMQKLPERDGDNGGGIPDPRTLMGIPEAMQNELARGSGGLGTDVTPFTPEQQRIWDALSQEQKEAWGKGLLRIPALGEDATGQSQAQADKQRDTVPGAIDAFGRGAGDTLSLGFADELAAGADTLFNGGTFADNLSAQRERDAQDARVNPYARFGGQVTGGLILPFGAEAKTAGELAKVGAVTGSLYGFGSGDDIRSRVAGAAKGGVAGAAGGYAFGTAAPFVGNALSRLRRPNEQQAERNALLTTAQGLGIDPMAADVGGAFTRRATAVGAQLPLSASPIVRSGERVLRQGKAARDRIAGGVAPPLETEAAGETAKAGAKKFVAGTRARADRLYGRAEELSKDARITPTRTIEALDRNIAELSAIPGMADSAELKSLQSLRQQIGSGNFSVAGVRGMRTVLSQKHVNEGLRGSDFQRRVRDIVDSASEDITHNLTDQGMDSAAQAFAAADGFWKTRVDTIDKVLGPIIGKDGSKSGEQVMRALESASKTNGRRLQQFMAALPGEERAAVQASVISRLGAASPGGQNAAGDAFSFESFLTAWSKMTPRAKAAMFPGETRTALDGLAKVAGGSREAGKYANRSNTGSVIGGVATGAQLGGLAYAPISTALGLVGQVTAGKLLASPRFAQWVARAPRAPGAMPGYLQTLERVGAKNPAISSEIRQFMQAANDNGLTRAAASGNDPRSKEQDQRRPR